MDFPIDPPEEPSGNYLHRIHCSKSHFEQETRPCQCRYCGKYGAPFSQCTCLSSHVETALNSQFRDTTPLESEIARLHNQYQEACRHNEALSNTLDMLSPDLLTFLNCFTKTYWPVL